MPRMSGIDPKSDFPVKTFFAPNSEMLVLNLWHEAPEYDKSGRMVTPAKDRKAYFEKGFYKTNRRDEIEAIEASYAYRTGDIYDYDAYAVEAEEAKVDRLLELVDKPEVREKLLAKLQEEQKKTVEEIKSGKRSVKEPVKE